MFLSNLHPRTSVANQSQIHYIRLVLPVESPLKPTKATRSAFGFPLKTNKGHSYDRQQYVRGCRSPKPTRTPQWLANNPKTATPTKPRIPRPAPAGSSVSSSTPSKAKALPSQGPLGNPDSNF